MPYQGPGLRKNNAVATKAVLHGDPAIELGVPGSAFKTSQLGPFVDPTSVDGSGHLFTQLIAVGEHFAIMIGGIVEARAAVINGGLGALTEGSKVYIDPTNNQVTTTSTNNTKFGVVQKLDAARGIARINTNLRDTF